MKNVPSHHHPEIQVAIRMARILAEADLVHPVADHVGEMDVMDWAAKFVAQHGTYLAPIELDRAQYSAAIKASTYQSAMHQGWVVREERETRGQSPADIEFKQAVAMALHIQEIPGHVPRSASHRALFNAVAKDLQERALHSLRMGGPHKKGEMSFETDGRFEKLKFHGISIASCSAGERGKDQWIAALESNLGLQVDPDADEAAYTVETVQRLLREALAQPAQQEPVAEVSAQFNSAIDFAILQGSEAAVFLRSWREGDTTEWPEFDAHGISLTCKTHGPMPERR